MSSSLGPSLHPLLLIFFSLISDLYNFASTTDSLKKYTILRLILHLLFTFLSICLTDFQFTIQVSPLVSGFSWSSSFIQLFDHVIFIKRVDPGYLWAIKICWHVISNEIDIHLPFFKWHSLLENIHNHLNKVFIWKH